MAGPTSSRTDETQTERLDRLERLHTEFLATVAHEIRDPMTSCIGYADMLLQKAEEMSDTERRDALATIAKTGRRLVQLLEDILEVARLEGGSFPYVMQPVDVNDVVRGVLDEQRILLSGSDVSFDPAPEATVVGDGGRLHQVFVNLLSNAVKFSPHGGPIRIASRGTQDHVVVSVQDEGIGINPEDIFLLFGRFARITQPGGSERVPGTGLGLYISKSIVEAHHGRIWVESEPGRGSTFFVAVPSRDSRT